MEQKTYRVARFHAGNAIDWNAVPVAEIDCYRWLTGYAPRATAQLVYVEGEAFVLRMTCAENAPRAVYTEYNQPVYTDSCLEFFAIWDSDSDRYVNMEMNARGTLLSNIGADRHERTPILDLCGDIFPVTGEISGGAWAVTATIPLAMIAKLYDLDESELATRLTAGYAFRGNFYKCGDETEIPHYGMWNPVGTEKPDFHRPEYFGTLVLD